MFRLSEPHKAAGGMPRGSPFDVVFARGLAQAIGAGHGHPLSPGTACLCEMWTRLASAPTRDTAN